MRVSNLATALELTGRGWAIFPLRPGTKAPATSKGLYDATKDEVLIRQWWTENPDYGIGIVTGAVSGLVVVDVDVKGGQPGHSSMLDLELPETLTARTSSGGWHLYFQHPGGLVRNAVGIHPGIDLRADGGYVVAYAFENDSALVPWEQVSDKFPQRSGRLSEPEAGTDVIEGGRNAYLTSLAGSMRARGMTYDSILAALTAENQSRCRPPLPQEEVEQVAQSVSRYVPNPPAPHHPGVQQQTAMTDLGNAERLLDSLGGLVKYSKSTGFYLYDGTCWALDQFDLVRGAAHRVGKELVRKGSEMAEQGRLNQDQATEDRGRQMMAWGIRSQSTRQIDSMIRELQAMPGVAVDLDAMDGSNHLLAFNNGTVDLRTGTLQQHNPDDLITKRLDLDYRPDAPCPRWLQFLDEVFPGMPQMPPYLQRLVGYGITGETSEQCFAVLWGTGANGKTVFCDTLTSVFRAVTTTTPFSTFEEKPSGAIPNDVAGLKGSRLVFASEGDNGRPMAEAVLKRATGRDLMTARHLFKEYFEFRPTFLILLATNHKPQFRGQDEGLWRRVKLIPWSRYFAPDERDHYLGDKLLAEAEGIAAWAVQGAIDWYARSLRDPQVIAEATKGYRETSDALAGFLPGVLEYDSSAQMSGSDAYHRYQDWAEDEGLPLKERWSRKAFYGALDERGISRGISNGYMTLRGVRLNDRSVGLVGLEAHSQDLSLSESLQRPTGNTPTTPTNPTEKPLTSPPSNWLDEIF